MLNKCTAPVTSLTLACQSDGIICFYLSSELNVVRILNSLRTKGEHLSLRDQRSHTKVLIVIKDNSEKYEEGCILNGLDWSARRVAGHLFEGRLFNDARVLSVDVAGKAVTHLFWSFGAAGGLQPFEA